MAIFDYNYLHKMYCKGEPLGSWKGKSVFSASVEDLKDLGSGVWYIPYDESRVIICREEDVFYSYGEVNERGQVEEYYEREVYKDFSPKSVSVVLPVAPATGAETTIADVKLALDVNDVLESARTLTVNSLLEGFNYGLDN